MKKYGTHDYWTTSALPDGFHDKLNALRRLPPNVIEDRWKKAGKKPIATFGLSWNFVDLSWISLDNQNEFVPGGIVFSIVVDPYYFKQRQRIYLREYFEQVAVLLAIELGMTEYEFVPKNKDKKNE